MTTLIRFLPVLSVLSVILAALFYYAYARDRREGRKARRTTVFALTAAAVAFANGAVDLGLKVAGVQLQPPDPASATLASFYGLTINACPRAWALIHSARRARLDSLGVHSDREWCTSYRTTEEYRNIRVRFVAADNSGSRRYIVDFDVRDRFPVNALYDFRNRRLSDAIDAGLVDGDVLLRLFVRDLSDGFQLPLAPETRDSLRSFLNQHDLEFALSPEAVGEAARYLNIAARRTGPTYPAWSHFTQVVTMQEEDGWKVRSGLYPPLLRVSYARGSELPVQ